MTADDINRVHELKAQGKSACAIERYTGFCRSTVRNIVKGAVVRCSNDLSTRERQRLLSWRAA